MPSEQDTRMEKGKYKLFFQCLLLILILSYRVTESLEKT